MNDPVFGRFIDRRNRCANLICCALWRGADLFLQPAQVRLDASVVERSSKCLSGTFSGRFCVGHRQSKNYRANICQKRLVEASFDFWRAPASAPAIRIWSTLRAPEGGVASAAALICAGGSGTLFAATETTPPLISWRGFDLSAPGRRSFHGFLSYSAVFWSDLRSQLSGS